VVAVSGGVDSVALLDLLVRKRQPSTASHQFSVEKTGNVIRKTGSNVRLIVAHYDHGIRYDSQLDRQFVQKLAKKYGLQFVYDEGYLGASASEAKARRARYQFLHNVRTASGADAIITAHHQDDLLETAILNLLRGTGRRGLSSLRSSDLVLRPLLHIPKKDLIQYADKHNLKWRDDPTNQDLKYLRNYIRHKILTKFSHGDREKMLELILKMHVLNDEIDLHLINHLHLHSGLSKLNRYYFIMLPHKVAQEVIAAWMRKHGVKDFDKKTIDRAIVAAKTYAPGKRADIDKNLVLEIGKSDLALIQRDR
jgi:tRNA(Ile)-lysidine synthetase-like protein